MPPNSISNGELAYVPANVKLVKYGDNDPKEYVVMDKPNYFLVVEDSPKHHGKIGILYKNATWYVNLTDTMSKVGI